MFEYLAVATATLYEIVDRRVRDQDHIRMLVDNRPEIPDRTDFILSKGPAPLPLLQESDQNYSVWA